MADGLYDLRLRIVYSDSNYDEYYVTRVRVANDTFGELLPEDTFTGAGEKALGLYLPRDGAQVTGLVDFVGATAIPDLLQWELYWSPVGADSWEFLVADTKPVVNGTLARLDLSLLPTGSYDFRLRLVRTNYTYNDFVVRNVQVTQPTPTPIPLTPPQ
ncbi:MAG: hypothetical protein IPK16_31535 [Anaerolineales bacterium]|nr:hypothetical protein [Anaerolineales bacterium]